MNLTGQLYLAAQACHELASRKFRNGYVRHCKHKKAGLECTALCACEVECSQKKLVLKNKTCSRIAFSDQ